MLEIEIGVNLIPLADPRRGGDLLKRIAMVRSEIASEIGIILPKVRIRDNLAFPGRWLSNQSLKYGRCQRNVDGRSIPGSANGREFLRNRRGSAESVRRAQGIWIEPRQADAAKVQGYSILTPESVLAQQLRSSVRQARGCHFDPRWDTTFD